MSEVPLYHLTPGLDDLQDLLIPNSSNHRLTAHRAKGYMGTSLIRDCPRYDPTVALCVGPYRSTSLVRKRHSLGPYRRPMPRVLALRGDLEWTCLYF